MKQKDALNEINCISYHNFNKFDSFSYTFGKEENACTVKIVSMVKIMCALVVAKTLVTSLQSKLLTQALSIDIEADDDSLPHITVDR